MFSTFTNVKGENIDCNVLAKIIIIIQISI